LVNITVTDEKFRRRFLELEKEFDQIRFVPMNPHHSYSPNGEWRRWSTSAENLILACFGDHAVHATRFKSVHDKGEPGEATVRSLFSIFKSAKSDFEGDYRFNTELTIAGEVFGDFVRLARQSLSAGYKDVAAVLASAALEDALKKYAALNEIDVSNVTMQEVINALKQKGLIGGPQKALIDTMPKIRNAALHADWVKISESEVGSILGFVEQFLLTKFTPT
jgi:hypothetical protein